MSNDYVQSTRKVVGEAVKVGDDLDDEEAWLSVGSASLIHKAYSINQTGDGRRTRAGERCQVSEPHTYT